MTTYLDKIRAEIVRKHARDAATPPWLLSLRKYIDATIAHHGAETERDEDGYAYSDKAGEQECEALWDDVVKSILSGERVTETGFSPPQASGFQPQRLGVFGFSRLVLALLLMEKLHKQQPNLLAG